MRRSTITRQELRERWETDVSPLLTAVRAGAARATEVGRREWARSHRRARMRRRARRWRLPWMAVAAALAAVGVMGGLRAARTDRSRTDPDLAAVRDEARAGVRARMEAGRRRLRAAAGSHPASPPPAREEPRPAAAPPVRPADSSPVEPR